MYELFGGCEGKQISEWIVKQGFGRKTFTTRYVFDSPQIVADIANAWRYIKEKSIEKPVKPDEILQQLTTSRLKTEKLRLFSPWGPRYNSLYSPVNRTSPLVQKTDPEMDTLREIKTILAEFRARGYVVDFLLMPADVYGTEINRLPRQFVGDYFESLEDAARKEIPDLTLKPWSSIREENSSRYEELKAAIERNFDYERSEYLKAVRVAKVFNPGMPEESARRYCIERTIEAIIISEVYDPIKMGLVRKEKDALDGPLKRVYIVQERAPWLR